MSLQSLLSARPNVEMFLSQRTNSQVMQLLNISADNITTNEELINVMLLVKAAQGNTQAKKYLDERQRADSRKEIKL